MGYDKNTKKSNGEYHGEQVIYSGRAMPAKPRLPRGGGLPRRRAVTGKIQCARYRSR